jgi:two pore calcium channel protein 2
VDLYADLKPKESTSTEENPSISDRTSLLNINDLPLPANTVNTSETPVIQSTVFIEDGIYHRSIHHKIDPTSLKIYRIYYSRPVRWLLGIVIFINLMLSFFEFPSSMSLSSDYRFRDITWHWPEPGCGVTEGIEIVCLLVFLVDCYAKFYLLGWRRFITRPWFVLYAIMVVISFVDMIVSLSFCEHRGSFPISLGYTLRIRRFFRPLFFIISSSIMKKFAKAAIKTLPQIFTVLFLLALHIYVFAMFGLLVFPREPQPINGTNETGYTPSGHSIPFENSSSSSPITNYSHYEHLESGKYFGNIFDALTSLLVLLTTANHPDVMIPIYQFNRFSSLYFILFLGLGAFIILNLLIAVTYNQFRGFFLKSLMSSFHRRRVAFRAAFTILAKQTRKLRGSSRPPSIELVSKDLVRQLLRKMHLSEKKISLMFTKLETTGGTVNQHQTQTQTHTVNWQQFRDIFDVVDQDPHETRGTSNESESEYYTNYRPFQWFQLGIRHRFFNYFTYVISVVNVLLVTIELEIAYDESFTRADSRLAYYNLFFVIYYTVEQVLKLVGYGCRRYFRSIGNVYEGVVTCALLFLEFLVLVLYDSPKHSHDPLVDIQYLNIIIRLMNIFIVLRLLRILVQVSYLRLLTSTMVDLIWNVRGFFGIIIVVYYLFAFLGMELFDDVDGPTKTCHPAPDYDNLLYFGNNFHDFASSLVTLWDVMVVNNWFIFLDKFACDSRFGKWAKLYFIAWWLVSAIICMNLFISLVLEIFLIKWEVWQRRNLDERTQMGTLEESGDQTESSGEGSQVCTMSCIIISNVSL